MDSIDRSLPIIPILLDEVMCNGTERGLTDCAHDDFGIHDCSNREDLGVFCLGKTLLYGLCDSTNIDKLALSISCSERVQ